MAAFWPVFQNGFVSWDDPSVLVDNTFLRDKEVLSWAFSTTFMGHYQPLVWLVWSSVIARFGAWAAAFHALSLLVHAATGFLVYALMLRLTKCAPLEPGRRRAAGLLAALLFLLHPTAVKLWRGRAPSHTSSRCSSCSSRSSPTRKGSCRCRSRYAVCSDTRRRSDIPPVAGGRLSARSAPRRIRRLLVEKVPFAVLAVAAPPPIGARDVATL